MNLKTQLLLQLTVAAGVCLLITSAYLLYRFDRQMLSEIRTQTDALGKQLEIQLLQISAGFGRATHFPDLGLWRQTHATPGICIQYRAEFGPSQQSQCTGSDIEQTAPPSWFTALYRTTFTPARLQQTRSVVFNKHRYGTVVVSANADHTVRRAWNTVSALFELSLLNIAATCLLVYTAISRGLKPAQTIVGALKRMQAGDLSVRLPAFSILEWKQTAVAINALAETQGELLIERERLTHKLLSVQEQERRHLARELHDELGQNLAAVNALTASIALTTGKQCPELIPETEQIARIHRRIMATVRNLLTRLRPGDIDALGLPAALEGLIAEWNALRRGQTRFELSLKGICRDLPEPLPIALYRIVQECLTNIVKHSDASRATITLTVAATEIDLRVADNGTQAPTFETTGAGLIGMRERVMALNGTLTVCSDGGEGFSVSIRLPRNHGELAKP